MPNGMTTEQMVERMYTELVGLDGKGGTIRDVRAAEEKIDIIEDTMVTKAACKDTRKDTEDRKEWNWKKKMGYFTLQVSLMGAIITVLGFFAKAVGLW